jgi:hypothetical protein
METYKRGALKGLPKRVLTPEEKAEAVEILHRLPRYKEEGESLYQARCKHLINLVEESLLLEFFEIPYEMKKLGGCITKWQEKNPKRRAKKNERKR